MKLAVAVIDTNVVVAGLLTREHESPTARILDGMRIGAFPFLLSTALLAEYRTVLLRPSIRKLHRLTEREVDALLASIATNGIVREPEPSTGAPDAKDDHLWSLVQCLPGTVLVTGDLALHRRPPARSAVLMPRDYVDSLSESP
jgi:predicted nucleic acid-binding protein